MLRRKSLVARLEDKQDTEHAMDELTDLHPEGFGDEGDLARRGKVARVVQRSGRTRRAGGSRRTTMLCLHGHGGRGMMVCHGEIQN